MDQFMYPLIKKKIKEEKEEKKDITILPKLVIMATSFDLFPPKVTSDIILMLE